MKLLKSPKLVALGAFDQRTRIRRFDDKTRGFRIKISLRSTAPKRVTCKLLIDIKGFQTYAVIYLRGETNLIAANMHMANVYSSSNTSTYKIVRSPV